MVPFFSGQKVVVVELVVVVDEKEREIILKSHTHTVISFLSEGGSNLLLSSSTVPSVHEVLSKKQS